MWAVRILAASISTVYVDWGGQLPAAVLLRAVFVNVRELERKKRLGLAAAGFPLK